MKFRYLLLFVLIGALTACETDNDLNINITEADLIGTWNMVEQRIEDGSISYSGNNQTINATYSAYAKDIDMTLTFADNPKKAIAKGKYTLVATINFNGQSQTTEEEADAVDDPNENPTWELNGNNITLSNDNDIPANLIVESYDGKTLKLKASFDETESDGGQTATIKATMYMTLEK